MKKISLSFLFTFISVCLFAQNGVKWEPDVNRALEKAKAEGKLLFVEAYLPTCPACQAVDPVFQNGAVAEAFNADFVNFKMDVTKLDGPRKFLDERGIRLPSFPQFLFFNGKGEIVHQGEVSPNPESLINVANDAKAPENWSSNYQKRFESGERDLGFLVKYGVYTRLLMDTTANHRVADATFEVFPKDELNNLNSWIITQKIVTSIDNGFFLYWIDHIPRAAELSRQSGHGGQEINILGGIVQSTLFSKEPRGYSTEKLGLMRSYMEKIGAGMYTDIYLWEYEALAKIRENKKEEALKIGKKIIDQYSTNGALQVYVAKVMNDNYPDNSYIPTVEDWLKNIKPNLKENNHLAEFYYELSRINFKSNQKDLALNNAREALKYARLAEVNTRKFDDLVRALTP